MGFSDDSAKTAWESLTQARDIRTTYAIFETWRTKPGSLSWLLRCCTEGLESKEPLTRRRSAQCLQWLGPEAAEVWMALREHRKDRSWTVREAIVQAMPLVGGLRSWDCLLDHLLFDRAPLVRLAAPSGIATLGQEAIDRTLPELAAAQKHSLSSVRRRALACIPCWMPLTEDQATVAIDLLQMAITAPDRKQRRTAVCVLGQLGAIAIPTVPDLIRRLHDRESQVSQAARAALGRLSPLLLPLSRRAVGMALRPKAPLEDLECLLNQLWLPAEVKLEHRKKCEERAVVFGQELEGLDAIASSKVVAEMAARSVGQRKRKHRGVEEAIQGSRDQEAARHLQWLFRSLLKHEGDCQRGH